MGLTDKVFDLVMPRLPKHDLSHWMGRAVHQPLPQPLARLSVEIFAQAYKINMNEAEHPISHYKTIGDLFTRKLKPGVRPIGEGVVHPADALISEAGAIENQTLIQAKGKSYTVSGLLGDSRFAKDFEGGAFLTYYLCPTDYHRVHSPVDGKITWACHIAGELWPVNAWSVNKIPNLFAVNERVAAIIETSRGKIALVMVAATNVGNMTLTFDRSLETSRHAKNRDNRERSYPMGIPLKRGDEFGIFHMGSTVVMLAEKSVLGPDRALAFRGEKVKMGGSLI